MAQDKELSKKYIDRNKELQINLAEHLQTDSIQVQEKDSVDPKLKKRTGESKMVAKAIPKNL